MTQLHKLRMANCAPRRRPTADVAQLMGSSFEIEFTDYSLGWEDPRIAPFMSPRPTSVVDDYPSVDAVGS